MSETNDTGLRDGTIVLEHCACVTVVASPLFFVFVLHIYIYILELHGEFLPKQNSSG